MSTFKHLAPLQAIAASDCCFLARVSGGTGLPTSSGASGLIGQVDDDSSSNAWIALKVRLDHRHVFGQDGRLLFTLNGSSCSGVNSSSGTCGTRVGTGGSSTVPTVVVDGGNGVVGTGFSSEVVDSGTVDVDCGVVAGSADESVAEPVDAVGTGGADVSASSSSLQATTATSSEATASADRGLTSAADRAAARRSRHRGSRPRRWTAPPRLPRLVRCPPWARSLPTRTASHALATTSHTRPGYTRNRERESESRTGQAWGPMWMDEIRARRASVPFRTPGPSCVTETAIDRGCGDANRRRPRFVSPFPPLVSSGRRDELL